MTFQARFSAQAFAQALGPCSNTALDFPTNTVALSTDTRTLEPGQHWFVPLKGARFDGHNHLTQAFDAGAVGAFVSQDWWEKNADTPYLNQLWPVACPQQAYLAMARLHRQRCQAKVVAITGSSGKTTVKTLLKTACSPYFKTQATLKNFNNEVGLCQTLLSLQPDTEILILELAMRGPGQIAELTDYAQPDIGVVINVGEAHLEFFQEGLPGIAKAKCELLAHLPTGSIGIVNGDDTRLAKTAQALWAQPQPLILYYLHEFEKNHYQNTPITVPLPGEHQRSNVLAVLKVCEQLGLTPLQVSTALDNYEPEEGRWQRLPWPGKPNIQAIQDAYNANPLSMRASIEAFLSAPPENPPPIGLVLAGMNELGPDSTALHQALGQWLAALLQSMPFNDSTMPWLVTVGTDAQQMGAATQAVYPKLNWHAVETAEQAKLKIDCLLEPLDNTPKSLLIKGSRGYFLETLLKN